MAPRLLLRLPREKEQQVLLACSVRHFLSPPLPNPFNRRSCHGRRGGIEGGSVQSRRRQRRFRRERQMALCFRGERGRGTGGGLNFRSKKRGGGIHQGSVRLFRRETAAAASLFRLDLRVTGGDAAKKNLVQGGLYFIAQPLAFHFRLSPSQSSLCHCRLSPTS